MLEMNVKYIIIVILECYAVCEGEWYDFGVN